MITKLYPTEVDREHFRKEDEEKRNHDEGICDSYCWICEEAKLTGDESLGG